MIGRLALRSLTAHPVRSGVLAVGFGVGVGVMAILLGVAQIVLDQAQSPALVGGGDVLIRLPPHVPARLVLSGPLQTPDLRRRVAAAAPRHSAPLYLMREGKSTAIEAHAGIPSLERALGDEEISSMTEWRDSPRDSEWSADSPAKVLRQIDRFHEVPDAPAWSHSWAEWLYFNGHAQDARFYLTFLVGPPAANGTRDAGVRLQLERSTRVETFLASQRLNEQDVQHAPDITIGGSSIRLEGLLYRIHLDLPGPAGRSAVGDLTIEAAAGRLLPPLEIAGANGWISGYVVPVMSGALNGALRAGGETVSFDRGVGYHDHNWGFWQGVSWQWGQAQTQDLSVIYGRVFPPRDAADPERVPGFIGVLGPDGPIGYTSNVVITETNDDRGRPRTISVRGTSPQAAVQLRFDVESAIVTRRGPASISSALDFLQLRGQYTVSGRAGGRPFNFSAPGAAETFRGDGR